MARTAIKHTSEQRWIVGSVAPSAGSQDQE